MRITAPDGHELQAEGPADLSLEVGARPVEGLLAGASLTAGLSLGDVRGTAIEGRVSVVLCHKESGVCARTAYDVSGEVPQSKRGTAHLAVAVHDEAEHPHSFGPDATAAPAEAAFERARATGNLVLLDFSAVWCPPCVVLAAEVLHAEPPPPELAGVEVAILDVDHPSSFAMKDRYEVGSYPTVVAVDAEGNELTRMVGYPGREAFLTWLAGAGDSTDASDLAKDPAEVSAERAAQLARQLSMAREFDAAAPWLARAQAASLVNVDVVLARTLSEPTPEGIEWLAEHAPQQAYDWAFQALDLGPEHGELLRRAAALAVANTRGSELGDALYLAAKAEPDAAKATLLYSAAASTVGTWMSDNPAAAKGSITWLARLMWLSGNEAGADETLRQASERYPDEPTFDLSRAGLWLDRDPAVSLEAATQAHSKAWGDNRLRTAAAMAGALEALDRRDEAKGIAQAALEGSTLDEQLDVRTHRYRLRLQAWASDD